MAETVLPRVYSVAEINNYLREYVEEDELLADLLVGGELSSFKRHSSGHIYFTLSGAGCSLNGAMFRNQASQAKFLPEQGNQVAVWGKISLYERDGRAQIYAKAFLPLDQQGAATNALDALKQKLAAEGLFDAERKRSLPLIPASLGVVTATGSAAWADIQAVTDERWPGLQVKLYPALVQGAEAPASIAAAIAKADKGKHSVLIVGRGGGASEDLAAFNTEIVTRAVAAAKTPLISAVGHEIDLTLTDLAADIRAATPSHAATLAVPAREELLSRVSGCQRRLQAAAQNRLRHYEERCKTANRRLERAALASRKHHGSRLGILAARLNGLSPLSTLARGYAVCRDKEGATLTKASQTQVGENVSVLLAEGSLLCRVDEVNNAQCTMHNA